MPRAATTKTPPAESLEILPAAAERIEAGQELATQAQQAAQALAVQMGYDGPVTVGTLEDEIRFYQRRSVEALLECGKRLLLLKELTPHGEFVQRVELLGIHIKTAQRFMVAAAKAAKSDNLSFLATQVKSASAFLELVTHDDDELEALKDMDAIDRMSASELRSALREAKADAEATQEVLDKKNARIDKLEREKRLIANLPRDEVLLKLQQEATSMLNDALGAIRGDVRQALIALSNDGEDRGSQDVFMAGLVGQLMAALAELREEFNLPDVSNAAQLQLAAEMKEWAE